MQIFFLNVKKKIKQLTAHKTFSQHPKCTMFINGASLFLLLFYFNFRMIQERRRYVFLPTFAAKLCLLKECQDLRTNILHILQTNKQKQLPSVAVPTKHLNKSSFNLVWFAQNGYSSFGLCPLPSED